MTTVVTGLFNSATAAGIAVEGLVSRGFDHDQISLIAGEHVGKKGFALDSHSKLPEGVALGGTTGAAIGALAAGLTAVGAVATGGVGLLAAGPIVAALAGAGVGATGGSILGGLVGLAIPEHEVKHYEDALERGYVMVGAECEDDEQEELAKDVFDACDAEKVSHA